MKLSTKVLCIIFICISSLGYSQFSDPIILNNSNRSTYNPAFAGIEYGNHVTSLGYRSSINQHRFYPFYPNPVFNNGIDLNGNSKKFYSGFGANIAHNFHRWSTRDSRYVFPNPGFKHYSTKNNNLNVKLNYNCKLNVGENSIFALGTSLGMFFHEVTEIYENGDEKSSISAISAPILSFGSSYSKKNFFIGFSISDINTGNDDFFFLDPFLSLNTGYNWVINERFSTELSLLILNGTNPSIIMLQNNFVYLKKYNFGGGYSQSYNRNGFHLFTGLLIKEKLSLNLAYKKFNHKFYRESRGFLLNESGWEISAVFKINSSLKELN